MSNNVVQQGGKKLNKLLNYSVNDIPYHVSCWGSCSCCCCSSCCCCCVAVPCIPNEETLTGFNTTNTGGGFGFFFRRSGTVSVFIFASRCFNWSTSCWPVQNKSELDNMSVVVRPIVGSVGSSVLFRDAQYCLFFLMNSVGMLNSGISLLIAT